MPSYGSIFSIGWSNTCIASIVVACLALAYFWSKRSSGMLGQFEPHISGINQMPDFIPYLEVLAKCGKCGYKISGEPCERCGSCPQCKSSDKCGYCQKFERQISLSERSKPCIICHSKPCKCVSATGKKVEEEPGIVRGVYAEHVVFDY